MRELILHIGAHKTGTTTIQAALSRHAPALAARGVSAVAIGGQPNVHKSLGRARRPAKLSEGFMLRDPQALLAALDAAKGPKVIASSELFSFFFQRAAIEDLAAHLTPRFDRVRVLVWLRRQDSQLVSHHAEGAKPRRRFEEELFGTAPTALPEPSAGADLYLDYNTRIGHWLDVFGQDAVTLRLFERARMVGGDPWLDFLDAAGIDPNGIAQAPALNAASGRAFTKLGHMLGGAGLDMATRAVVLGRLEAGADRLLPARSEAERLYARYAEGNRALARRLGYAQGEGLFAEDFSDWPEAAQESWDEASANAAITALVGELAQRVAEPGADRLRDAALMAERAGDPDLAQDLLTAALTLRPDGPILLALQDRLASAAGQKPRRRRLSALRTLARAFRGRPAPPP